jgi:hypothetical protein
MRKTVSEQVRHYDPSLAEALEEREFSDQDVADELRAMAADEQPVSNKFFNLMALARRVEEL